MQPSHELVASEAARDDAGAIRSVAFDRSRCAPRRPVCGGPDEVIEQILAQYAIFAIAADPALDGCWHNPYTGAAPSITTRCCEFFGATVAPVVRVQATRVAKAAAGGGDGATRSVALPEGGKKAMGFTLPLAKSKSAAIRKHSWRATDRSRASNFYGGLVATVGASAGHRIATVKQGIQGDAKSV
jgi:hypothetical protein